MDDEQLIREFMQAHKAELPDQGFTRNVMDQLSPCHDGFASLVKYLLIALTACLMPFLLEWNSVCTFLHGISQTLVDMYFQMAPITFIILAVFLFGGLCYKCANQNC